MQFSAKPVFVFWIAALSQLPLQIFFTFWCGGFFGGISQSVLGSAKGDGLVAEPFLIFGVIGFFAVPVFAVIGKRLSYGKTEYRFYDDRLEFDEGYFTVNRKVIKFRDVKEVTLRKGFLQRMAGLGTIYLATLATGPSGRYAGLFGNASLSGVGVRDVPDPDRLYEQIKALVDRQG